MNIYCVYLTIYRGNKLPPFYIGSSSVKIISEGYKGTVKSKKYKEIWKSELKHNSHLFSTKIIYKTFDRKDALNKERFFQKSLNVVSSPLYANMSIAHESHCFGISNVGIDNPMFGKKNIGSSIWMKEYNRIYGNRYKNKFGNEHPTFGLKNESVTESNKKRIGNNNTSSKNFLFISPEGVEYYVDGFIKRFCKEHNINYQYITKYRKLGKSYKGWTSKEI